MRRWEEGKDRRRGRRKEREREGGEEAILHLRD